MTGKTLHITSGLAKLGCKVITRTSARPLTVSDNPNGVQSSPNFQKCQHLTSGLAKLGGKVITRTSARPLTVSDNPNGVQSSPNFAKPPERYRQPMDNAAQFSSEKN